MPSYFWENYQGQAWNDRYPLWAEGSQIWQQQPRSLLAPPLVATPYPKHPRLFISHRQVDVGEALRVAWLADQEGFEYWLDIVDPTLAQLQRFVSLLAPLQHAVAVASLIEMALLNSSHVLALITPNSKGSAWIPFEYGRIPRAPNPWPACCWIESSVTSVAEYLYLGAVTHSEHELRTWLRAQLAAWNALHKTHVSGPAGNWNGPAPAPM